jgi:hypothetical protein
MNATYEVHDGCTTLISDAGRAKLASEQRMDRVTSVHTAMFCGSAVGLVVTVCTLVITKILGA